MLWRVWHNSDIMAWLWKRVHISWFIAALCAGIIFGTALCLVLPYESFTDYSMYIIAASLLFIALLKRPKVLLCLAFAAGLCVGLVRGSMVIQDFSRYEPYYEKHIVLEGRVVEDVSYGESGEQRIRLGNISIGSDNLRGEVWASVTKQADIRRGDLLKLDGTLHEGFGNLQATMFRTEVQQAFRPQPGDIGRQFRDWFASGIERAIPEPEVSLGTGYLLGQKNSLPEELEEQIRITGLTHVVVASGYNLMILVIFARKALSRISKYLATLAGGTMIAGFMLITGLSPSMSRAGLVAGLGLLAWYYGRRLHPLILLPFAAAITLLIRPAYIWGDVGWLLSFAAFAGILMLAPLLHSYFWGENKKPGFIRELFIATLSAQILTLPIIIYVFGQYSPYALLANILVLPVVPFAMMFTFIAGAGSLLLPGLAHIFGLPATALLKYSTTIIEKIAEMPGAAGEIKVSSVFLIASYAGLISCIAYLAYKTRHNYRSEKDSLELI